MALMSCPECQARLSDRAFACPACGYPLREGEGRTLPGMIGSVAGTYISAQALVAIVVGSVMVLAFAAIMVALILR